MEEKPKKPKQSPLSKQIQTQKVINLIVDFPSWFGIYLRCLFSKCSIEHMRLYTETSLVHVDTGGIHYGKQA